MCIRNIVYMKDRLYPIYGMRTTVRYGKVRAVASINHLFWIIYLHQLKMNLEL